MEVIRTPLVLAGRPVVLEHLSALTTGQGHGPKRLHHALEDALTGLGNRRAFDHDLDAELAQSVRHGYPIAVIMADLDGLKAINDKHGHGVGDMLLRTFAEALSTCFLKGDRLYRLGGDEFALLLSHTDVRGFGSTLAKVRDAIALTRQQNDFAEVDVSIGCASFPKEVTNQGELVRLADERMYAQKRAHHAAQQHVYSTSGVPSKRTIHGILQRTVRSTLAFLSGDLPLDAFSWEALLQAAVISVPGSDWGALFVLEDRQYVARALVGYPTALLNATQGPETALSWYGGVEDDWRQGRTRLKLTTDELTKHLVLLPPASDLPGLPARVSLCVPVIVEGRVVAHLNLDSLSKRPFSREAIKSALEFGEQVAALLASRTRRQREADRERELTALANLNVALGQVRTTEAIEAVLVDQAIPLLVTRYATYFQYDPVSECLMSSASSGMFNSSSQIVLPRGVGLSWGAVDQKDVVHYIDARTERGAYQHEEVTVSLSTLYAPLLTSNGDVLGVLAVGREASPFSELDVKLAQAITSAAATSLERAQETLAVQATRESALLILGLALEARDFETEGHTRRVVHLAAEFSRALGLSAQDAEALREGAYLHDIGKLCVPDRILLKPGPLSGEEREIMQDHAAVGHEMVKKVPRLSALAQEVVRHHHERWDGTGYPDGLCGPEIPRLARIFALIDVFDALTSERVYKRAWTVDAACGELARLANSQFDPELVPVFLTLNLHRVADVHVK
ncbi:HD domain-containing phosphohydrolase [Deinococcus oregonensis]|uniref:HD domain-containing phosphohydrolase n=1 Tax=Deinococcus oregonensis TaxID=1805970 RepID=A0ABV6B373_9DEIO